MQEKKLNLKKNQIKYFNLNGILNNMVQKGLSTQDGVRQ